MVLISAGDLIMLYLGLELMSLALYVVAASNRDNAKSTEAGLKYFVLGALSSGMLLYGASLIYGFTGTVDFRRHRRGGEGRQHRHRVRAGVPAGGPLLQGLRGAVPHVDARRLRGRADAGDRVLRLGAEGRGAGGVHPRGADRVSRASCRSGSRSWCSSPSPRWCWDRSPRSARRNIKRLMAYSSIGHMGFALVGLAAGTAEGAQGVLVYIAIYVAMTLGTLRDHPGHEAQRPGGREHQRFRRPVAHQSAAGVLLRDAAVLAGRHSAARRLLREVLCVRRRDQGRAVHARRWSACSPAWSAPITISPSSR